MSAAVRASAFTEPTRPKNLVIRFVTLGGSYVDVTGPGEHDEENRWNCHGCRASCNLPEQGYLFRTRPDANNHAAAFLAIPLR
nr:hypothetical protein OG409_37720 [Streptomyces sp. NBC_00974]